MQVGTKVYWYSVSNESFRQWHEGKTRHPVPDLKHTGTVALEPKQLSGKWICLVSRDADGRIVEKICTNLYVVPREMPL